MRRTAIAAVAVLAGIALVATGCGPGGTTPRAVHARAGSASPTAAPDAIRGFDLRSAAWHHPMLNTMLRARTQRGDRTVTLHGGSGKGSTPDGGAVSCRSTGTPAYGDIGGGAQVVAAGLACSAGVNDYVAYYVWRWDAGKHTAVQDDQPLVVGEHCGSEVRRVAFGGHAFHITVGLAAFTEDSCAESANSRTPYSYTVVERHGYLMRSTPEPGAVRECAALDGDMHQLKGVTLHADRDAGSPVVYRPKGLATLWTVGDRDYYESTDDLTGKPTRWQFVRANLPHGYICGYRQVS